ncbi:MAG: hypothetical protein HYY49_09035 [Ignavibacteriales bacterium]|nr:hypothetical protein [Ignavibacteriales bacterium]
MKSSLIFGAFAIHSIVSGCSGGFGASQSTKLTAEEDSLLQENWKIAYQLADYDRFSWIATDSLLRYVGTPDSTMVQGWVVSEVAGSTKVIFGKLQDLCLEPEFEVTFERSRIVTNAHPQLNYCKGDDPYTRFVAMSKARDANKTVLESANFPYNTYVLGNEDTLAVYLMPGATNNYYGFCGGIRTLVNARDLAIIQTKKLHQSPLITGPPPAGAVAMMRTSSLGVVPNEVDLAQTLIFRDLAADHMIITSKYTFIFSWDNKRMNVSMDVQPRGLGK